MYMWGASGFPQVLLRAVMSKKAQHFSVENVASWALPMILNHQEFFLFFPLKATGCLASLCAKKSTRIYHSVIGREDKRSLVACFDIWYEGIPSIIMIFFLCSLAPKRSPCITQELEKAPLSHAEYLQGTWCGWCFSARLIRALLEDLPA